MIIHAMYMLTQKTTDRHQLTFEVFEYHVLLVLFNILWIEQYLRKVNDLRCILVFVIYLYSFVN